MRTSFCGTISEEFKKVESIGAIREHLNMATVYIFRYYYNRKVFM
jgi:hypothetical protein